MFYEKYVKYKKKYFLLKSQIGGVKENDYVKSTDKKLVSIYARNGWPNIFKINKIFSNGNISVLNLSLNITLVLPSNTVEVLNQNDLEKLIQEVEEYKKLSQKNEEEMDEKMGRGEEEIGRGEETDEEIKLENYYLVHNYFKTYAILPYKKLIPRGDSGFRAVEKFANSKSDLENYMSYAKSKFILSEDLPPAQSNIGIFFWLIPKTKIPLNKIFKPEDIDEPLKLFSYVFDAKQLFKYIIYKLPKFGSIPNIYWSPKNWYGQFGPGTIPIYREIDLLAIQKNMKGDVKKTHEVVSLHEIDTEDKKSGFIGYSNGVDP